MQPDFSRDARIASILTRIAQLPKKPRLLVTIDGPCGSGKSTLADALSAALNAPIIRTTLKLMIRINTKSTTPVAISASL